MGKDDHSITFELASGTNKFFPGGIVEGAVTFNLHKDIPGVKSVYVSVKGIAHVHWTETHKDHGSDTEKVSYTAKEKYVKRKVVLLDGGGSSIKAYVKYNLKGKIKRESSSIKDEIKLQCLGDTRLPQDYLNPLIKEKQKRLGILCCKQGPIKIRVS